MYERPARVSADELRCEAVEMIFWRSAEKERLGPGKMAKKSDKVRVVRGLGRASIGSNHMELILTPRARESTGGAALDCGPPQAVWLQDGAAIRGGHPASVLHRIRPVRQSQSCQDKCAAQNGGSDALVHPLRLARVSQVPCARVGEIACLPLRLEIVLLSLHVSTARLSLDRFIQMLYSTLKHPTDVNCASV